MKLYYSKGACSLVVRIVLHEINFTCDYEAVDLKSKKTEKGEEFLKINPKGAVPTLVIDNRAILTENAVILQYLADTNKATQLLPPVGDFNRYRVLEWLNFITTELHKGFGPIFNAELPQDIKDKIFKPLLEKKFRFVDKQLEGKHYLFGEHFTLPDAYLFVILRWAAHFKFDLSQYANLDRYFADLKKRPSISQALREEGLTL